jgi:hypothetical protein
MTLTHRHPAQAILGITEAFKADSNPKVSPTCSLP